MCTGTGPYPPMSSVQGEVLILDGNRCVSSVDGNLTAAVFFPGGVFVPGNERNNGVKINTFHLMPI